jgi:hypothetical protein
MKKFTDQEVKAFMSRTNEELVIQDPLPVLQDLGIEYKEMGNDSYKMNLRNEKTASAYITLKDGTWKYKDFGSGTNGNIINVVMDATGKGFKQALNYSLQTLHVKNYLEEALNSKTQSYELYQADRERIKAKREQNRTKERSHVVSRVTAIYEVSSNQLAIDYLKARGIIKIPLNMKLINGEYENKHGEVKKAFGVGVLTRDGKGADIHFLKKIGDLKTMSFGEKDISFFKNPNSKKVAIFESKIDWASAYQQMPLDDVNVVIANSSSNAIKIAELLKKENLQSVMMFNQNDLAGYKFVVDVVKNADIQEFKSLSYQVMNEYKKDINDLLLDGEKIADRIENRPLEYFETIANSLEAIQKQQQTKPAILTNKDLKQASRGCEQLTRPKDNERGL